MMYRLIIAIVAVGVVLLALFAQENHVPLEVAIALLFGWLRFLFRVLPRVTVARDQVATGLVCLTLFATGVHIFSRRLYDQVARRRFGAGRWRLRWTAALVASIVVMFAAGIGATGVTHQVGWLLTAKRDPIELRVADWAWRPSVDRLKEVHLALMGYVNTKNGLPGAPPHEPFTRPLHSWQTKILPYLAIRTDLIDLQQPWNARRNAPLFKTLVIDYLHPDVGTIWDEQGFGLSHYAGNIHLLGRGRVMSLEDAGRGASNLIVAGELGGNFLPWGDPTNLRDPARGVNADPDGFGSPTGDGTQLLFLDGSVRFFGNRTDRAVLKSLASPSRAN